MEYRGMTITVRVRVPRWWPLVAWACRVGLLDAESGATLVAARTRAKLPGCSGWRPLRRWRDLDISVNRG